jgi:hypothetical protein
MDVVAGAEGGHLSPLSFQGGIGREEDTGIGLAGISLDGSPPVYERDDRPRVVKVGKTFSLVAYPTMPPMHIVGPGLHQEDVCGGIIEGGSSFCTKLAHDCHYSNHRANIGGDDGATWGVSHALQGHFSDLSFELLPRYPQEGWWHSPSHG